MLLNIVAGLALLIMVFFEVYSRMNSGDSIRESDPIVATDSTPEKRPSRPRPTASSAAAGFVALSRLLAEKGKTSTEQ